MGDPGAVRSPHKERKRERIMTRGGNVSHFDEVQFEKLYRQEYGKMLSYATLLYSKLTGSRNSCGKPEEAVQDAFALAWRKREALFASPKPVGWLYVALNKIILNIAREERRWSKMLNKMIEVHNQQVSGYLDIRLDLSRVVSEEDWNLLMLFYVEGYTYKELCTQMNAEKSTLAMRVKRAKEKIKKALE